MTKPYGSASPQLSPNDRLGRFAFLDALPPDVLKALQDLSWHLRDTVQVDDDGKLAASPHVANKQYVQNAINSASTLELIDGQAIIPSAEQLAAHTFVLSGELTTGGTVTIPGSGQWFIVNRSTGASATVRGVNPDNPVVFAEGENGVVYIDSTGATLLSSPYAKFISYHPFTAAANQTVFSFPYTPNLVLGFCAGKAYLPTADFDATSGDQVILGTAANAGDQWVFVAFTATSVANAVPLSGGALEGPLTLTAGTTAPTPDAGVNDASLATMAALYRDLRAVGGVLDVAQTSFEITRDHVGVVLNFQAEAATDVDMPVLADVPPLGYFDLVNATASGVVTLNATQPFDFTDPYTDAQSMIYLLGPGESVRVVVDPEGLVWRLAPGFSKTQGRILAIKTYLSAGTYTYTRTQGTRSILVYGAGAGAASGGLPACPVGYVAVAQAGSPGAKAFATYDAGFDTTIVTVGAGGAPVAANDAGQVGQDGSTSSFGTLLTLHGGKGGAFAQTNSASGVTAYSGEASVAPSGSGIVSSCYGTVAPAAFVNTGGMFGGIDRNGQGLDGSINGLGGMGQFAASAAASDSTPTNAGNDGGFIIYELS